MGIGVSIFLIAVGAIITFAINATVSGIDLATVGVILMVVGGIGLLWSLILAGTARRGAIGGTVVEDRTAVDSAPPVERTVYRDR